MQNNISPGEVSKPNLAKDIASPVRPLRGILLTSRKLGQIADYIVSVIAQNMTMGQHRHIDPLDDVTHPLRIRDEHSGRIAPI